MDLVEHRPIYLMHLYIEDSASFDSSNLFITRLLIFYFANKRSLIVQAFQRQLKALFHTFIPFYTRQSGLSNYYLNGRYGSSARI